MFKTLHFFGLRDGKDKKRSYAVIEKPGENAFFQEIKLTPDSLLSWNRELQYVHRIYIDNVYDDEQWDDLMLLLEMVLQGNMEFPGELLFEKDEKGEVYIDYAEMCRRHYKIREDVDSFASRMRKIYGDFDFDEMYGYLLEYLDEDKTDHAKEKKNHD